MRKLLVFLILCSTALADKPYRILNSFNAGELTSLLSAREDLTKYQSGCSLMENMFPIPQGGAQKRPGTIYVAESKNNTKIRLLPFEYSTEQSYIIELGNQYMRFFTSSAVIYKPTGTEDLSGIGSIVAHWKCNDNLATTVVIDAETGHNGMASANTDTLSTTDAAGTANTAFDMGGAAYFTRADHADFFFDDDSDEPFSLAAWVYYETTGSDQTIISKYTAAGSNREWKLEVVGATDKVRLILYDDANQKACTVTANNTLADGWHFIVSTSDGRGGGSTHEGVNLYVDYSLQDITGSTETGYTAMEDKAADIVIGAQEVNTLIWEGKIDNVAVFTKELSAVEIASLTGGSSTTDIYEITTPYLTADLFELKYEQSADVLYITHPDYETRKLSRMANAVWLLEAIGIENGSFRTQNTDTVAKITASATTGSVTLTATSCTPFVSGTTAGHLASGSTATSKSQTGALFKLVHPIDILAYQETLENNYTASQVENTSWVALGTLYKGTGWTLTTTGTWTGTLEIQRNYTIGAAHGASGWEKVLQYLSADDRNVSTTGTEESATASYRAILTASGDAAEPCQVDFEIDEIEHIGIVEITAVASTTSATATVLTTLGSTNATHKWSEGSWSNYRGWPQTVAFFEDRLIFGGNTAQPDTIWGSVTADYENMLEGTDDDDAVIFTLTSRQVNVIQWLVGKNKILIGTSGAEWTLAGSSDEPLAAGVVPKAEQHSTYGSEDLQAVLANESILFFQRGATKMRELAYNWELDTYVAPDMTILSKEVTGDGITDIAFQQIPDSILWCVRDDGELPVFAYERKEQITSWSRLITDGDFESVAIINGDPEDEVWVSVERVIGISTVRYIEYFSARDFGSDPCDAFYVDSGIIYDSTATSSLTAAHLKGETLSILADGVVFDDAVANASTGVITLKKGGVTTAASTVQYGLPFTVQLRTMPLSWIAQGMTIQGRIKRINEVVARWYVSGDFSIGKDADTLGTYSIDGQTTDEDRKTFPPGYGREGYVFIYQQSPEPLTLLALMIEFMVD